MLASIDYGTRDRWLASRSEAGSYRIGASEVAAVCGLSPYRTPLDIWLAHHAPHLLPAQTGGQLADGQAWEPRAVRLYEVEHLQPGLRLQVEPMSVHYDDDRPWLRVTLDAGCLDPLAGRIVGIVEIKTDRTFGAAETWPADATVFDDPAVFSDADPAAWPIRADYFLQVQTAMHVTGAPWCDLCVWIPHYSAMPECRRLRVVRMADWFAAPLRHVEAWRERHLLAGDPPDASDPEGRERLARWRYPARAESRPATPDEARDIAAYLDCRAAEAASAATARDIRAALVVSMGSAKKIWCHAGSVSISTKGAVTITAK